MNLDPAHCYRALSARDARFDGRFFIGVRSTGIYCRPICPARTPLRRNVDFYPSAAAAAEAGFRPCRRCRPEASPGTPAWRGTSSTVTRALRLVQEGALDTGDVDGLAARLGIGERHLRRLFREHLGASPVAVAQTRRLHFAKKLIDETDLSMTATALAAGFGSVRRFNAALRDTYGVPPSALRGSTRGSQRTAGTRDDGLSLRLAYRPPLARGALLDFLALRAVPGVEEVVGGVYRRSLSIDGVTLRMEIDTTRDDDALWLRVPASASPVVSRVVGIARGLFDLDADPDAIGEVLGRDPLLAPILERTPGLRVPGAADGHELAVRAVLGQQVSVVGARTLAARLVARFGTPLDDVLDGETVRHVFPTAERLADADVGVIGMPAKRAAAIRGLSGALAAGDVVLAPGADPDATRRALLALPGIGPWTADYIAMRGLREPDAFPSGDLVLRRNAGAADAPLTDRALVTRAEGWRPWRAYAAIALWRAGSVAPEQADA